MNISMASKMPDITLKAIGIIRNEIKQPQKDGWENVISDIVVDNSLTEALDGLEDFSHILVIYWMHLVVNNGKLRTKVHPRHMEELPLVGLFASRSPNRPNPIGKAIVRLLHRDGNILKVEGLDAVDGSLLIDIKPYIPGYDSVDDAKVPQWIANQ